MNKRRVIIGIKSSRDLSLLTLGQLLLRLSPPNSERLSRGGTFMKQVDGAELDMAMGATLLGLHTGVMSKLPAHDIGSFMRSEIRSFGVNDGFFMCDQSSSVRVGIYYYENDAYPRKPKVIYDRNNSPFFSLNIDEIPEEVYTASKCFHTTGITLTLNERIRETATEIIKQFKAAETLMSFGVSFRGNLWTRDETEEYILRTLPYVDIFFYSGDTARLTFLKTGAAKKMMESFSQEFPISIVVSTQRTIHNPKCYTFGSAIYDTARDEYYEEEPYWDIEVVGRIGNGDAYISDALYGLLSSGGDYSRTITYNNATAAVKNTISGDLPSSSLEEIETIIKAHNQIGP